MHDTADWKTFDNILCVRPDNLGDLLMTTPALRALKDARAGRRITLLASRAGAAIAPCLPEVDEVLVFDPPWYRHEWPAGRAEMDAIVEQLKQRDFDGAVLFTVFSQNPLPAAMLCYMSGIARVAGYCRENPYALMSDWLPDKEPLYEARHEVQRQLDLVTWLGATPRSSRLSLRVPAIARQEIRALLKDAGVAVDRPWLLLHPGASEARRRYPAQRFAAAAKLLVQEHGLQVVVTGSGGEAGLAQAVAHAAGDGVVSLAGRLDLAQLVNLVGMAPLLISNNTGPVHIAAALQTPVVVLYAQTNPQHTPWCVPNRVLPFGVPPDARSRNVLVRLVGERFFADSAGMPEPEDVVAATLELLDLGTAPEARPAFLPELRQSVPAPPGAMPPE